MFHPSVQMYEKLIPGKMDVSVFSNPTNAKKDVHTYARHLDPMAISSTGERLS